MNKELTIDKPADSIVSENVSRLILHNDEFNSFIWVISSLCEVLKIDSPQAEQLAMLAHHKGKVSIKSGNHDDLKPFKDALNERGIETTIET